MSLKFLYATDLHGDHKKFYGILNYAIQNKIKLIHLGADILPGGVDLLKKQETFVSKFLKNFYKKAEDHGIKLLAFFGNDDLYCLKDSFKQYGSLLDENPEEIEGYTFKAYGYVPDHPFPLKNGCKLDYPGWVKGPTEKDKRDPVDFINHKKIIIKEIDSYFKNKGSIQEDLEQISADKKTIMSTHSPPSMLGLDVCGFKTPFYGGIWIKTKEVGSKSIYEWTEKNQPVLLLCGHIHYSPKISKKWRNKIGNTFIIQPGQYPNETTFVKIYIKDSKVRSSLFLQK
jgi:uncharacterized protein